MSDGIEEANLARCSGPFHEGHGDDCPYADAVPVPDLINHPPHYTAYPVEVIELTEHLNFCRGNAVKYIARAGLKGGPEDEITDLEKARWYVDRELRRLKVAREAA